MQFVNYISNLAIPLIILIIVLFSVMEKQKVFDDFLEGAKEGIGLVVTIFPTLIGLFFAIGALRSSRSNGYDNRSNFSNIKYVSDTK